MIPSTNSASGRSSPGRGALRAVVAAAICAGAVLLAGAYPAGAQVEGEAVGGPLPGDSAATEVAGLRFGSWEVTGLERMPQTSYSEIPVVDLYYERELGRKTTLQLGLGLWRRGQVNRDGTVAMWVGPVFGGIRYYPVGGPEGAVDPYLSVAGGPVLGFEQRRSSGFGSLESGWTAAVGGGAEAGGGVDLELGPAVGLVADVQYQWVRYLAGELDSPDTYRGVIFAAGITYRLGLR